MFPSSSMLKSSVTAMLRTKRDAAEEAKMEREGEGRGRRDVEAGLEMEKVERARDEAEAAMEEEEKR